MRKSTKKIIEHVIVSGGIDKDVYYVGVLNGSQCRTMKAFLKQIGKTFKFPSYYGKNLDALDECLNDLEWIDRPNYILVVKDFEEFLRRETEETKTHILAFFERVSKEWANVPNYEGEDIYRKKADFIVRFI